MEDKNPRYNNLGEAFDFLITYLRKQMWGEKTEEFLKIRQQAVNIKNKKSEYYNEGNVVEMKNGDVKVVECCGEELGGIDGIKKYLCEYEDINKIKEFKNE